MKGEREMKKFKADYPKITFRPSEKTKQDFRKKCFNNGFSQDEVLIELVCAWNKGKVKIPQEGNK